ncbi:hypothetical protein K1T71_003181 [Dendrolimus kikuchii]|uniref:Uncharacterized protein n=1 Tax=Dendrolimus kikuchii TaxID=765133 RepID=A0ACC1DBS0_9NEOP|nr:hypothetical protein K1T71_003181 [Dendrolimus kikuchii]
MLFLSKTLTLITLLNVVNSNRPSPYVNYVPQKIPNTFRDVFLPGSNGKPSLGSSKATCWIRGGICTEINSCPSFKMDVAVPGCDWGHKVCCKVFKFNSPTVGQFRTQGNDELVDGDALELEERTISGTTVLGRPGTTASYTAIITEHSAKTPTTARLLFLCNVLRNIYKTYM